jgi:hypothetical protein
MINDIDDLTYLSHPCRQEHQVLGEEDLGTIAAYEVRYTYGNEDAMSVVVLVKRSMHIGSYALHTLRSVPSTWTS